MATSKRNFGQEFLAGLRELKRGEVGRVIDVPLLGVSVRTLQDWEQGRRAPSGAARTLPLIAQRNPRALQDVA
jgi:putative transcriptional regulator